MTGQKDGLRYEPLYRYHPAEGKPRRSLWKLLLQIFTLGLIGRPHREEFKTKGGAKHVHLSAEEGVVLRLRTQRPALHRQLRHGLPEGGEGGTGSQER